MTSSASTSPAQHYRFADLTLDLGRHSVRRGDDPIPLSKLTFELLRVLVEQAPNVVGHDQLAERVWGPRRVVTPETLAKRVMMLRRALGDQAEHPRYVEGIRGHGYRLIPEIRPLPAEQLSGTEELQEPSTAGSKARHGQRILIYVLAAFLMLAVGFLVASRYVERQSDSADVQRLSAASGPASSAEVQGRHRLAVLALADDSPDPEDAYFADGLTAELITRLSTVSTLRVIARESVGRLSGIERSVAEIGSEVAVGSILQGSVRKEGDRVRVAVNLVDVASGEEIWSDVYDARLTDAIELQRRIAEQVAGALQVQVGAAEFQGLGAGHAVVPAAYEQYLRGRHLLGKADAVSHGQARDHFRRALDLDPEFASAWSGLADAYEHLIGMVAISATDGYPRVRAAAERALQIDPALAAAHVSLASALDGYYRDADAAESHYRSAIALDPSYARGHRLYAEHLRNRARFDEALTEARQAQQLDPLTAFPWLEEAIILYMSRRYDEAIDFLHRLLEVEPSYTYANVFLALSHAQKGEHVEALSALEALNRKRPGHPDALSVRGYVYANIGRRDDARADLDALAAVRAATGFHRAIIHVGLGNRDRAIELLEEAADERAFHIRILGVEPIFDPLRGDRRFAALLDKVGVLTPTTAAERP